MDIFEFELRYRSYEGLATRLGLDWNQEMLLELTKRTSLGSLSKNIQECSLDELWDATRKTYTPFKKTQIENNTTIINSSGKTIAEYIDRLEYELKVIFEMGYNTYFLVVKDYITRARNNQIVVGPGRGSCAGSLLSYATAITDLDPLEYDLIFERFLNPGRISMPDIDTDFEDTLRDRVIGYIRNTYGEDKVAHIGTYMTMAAKAAFKDVARVYGVKFEQSNKISGLITEKTIQESIDKNKDLKEVIDSDSRIKNAIEVAIGLEGTVRQTGVHACGMIIAPQETITYTPIQYPPKTGSKSHRDETRVVSQFEGPIIEDLGLLKMDILGLRNLSIIKHTIKILVAKAKSDNEDINPLFTEFLETMLFHPPLDDEHTFKRIFHTGDTSGVFQFESDGMKSWMKKLKPTGFEDLIAMVSLYRPGPMEFIPHYIDRKYEIEPVTYMQSDLYDELKNIYGSEIADEEKKKLKEDLEPFMSITYGIAIYQEQLMRLVQSMAGFSMSEADKLRKGVGKKIKDVIEKIKKEFIKKSQKHKNYKPETAKWIYEKMIEPAADYSFNKSHAACYAYIAYQTAWLKAHYPIEFHAALLRSVEEETDKLSKFIDEVKQQGYPITLPDINKSFEHVAAIEGKIYLGFRSIKGIGSDISEFIEKERISNGVYKSLPDFLKRLNDRINKKSLEALIKSGSLDQFYDRFTLIANTQRILDRVKSSSSQQASAGLFAMDVVEGADLTLTKATDEGIMPHLAMEYDVYKTLISAHPLDGMYTYIKSKYNFSSMFNDKENFGEYTMLGYVKSINRGMRGGFFMKVEDMTGEVEFYLNEKLDFSPFDLVIIKGYKSRHAKIDSVMVFTHQELVEKITKLGQYNPSISVDTIRKERNLKALEDAISANKNSKTTQDQETIQGIESDSNTCESLNASESLEETPQNATIFKAPETITDLQTCVDIIKNHPGTISVTIGTLEAKTDEQGLSKLNSLLGKILYD